MEKLEPRPGRGPSAIDPIVAAFPAAPPFRPDHPSRRPVLPRLHDFLTVSKPLVTIFLCTSQENHQRDGRSAGSCNSHAEMCHSPRIGLVSLFIHDKGEKFSRWVLARSESLIIVNGGNFAPPVME